MSHVCSMPAMFCIPWVPLEASHQKKEKNPFSSFLYFVICYWFEFSVFPSNHQHILCRAPNPPPRKTKGVRDCIGTLYFLFQTLVGPSLIIESKYHIKRIQNKTTTVVVFTVSIHIVLSLIYIYIYIYKNCTFTFTYSEHGTYMW